MGSGHKLALVLLTLAVASVCWGESKKYILNYKRLSTTEVGVSCENGADPTGKKFGNTLIISCGQ